MSISITNENKNTLSVSNEAKRNDKTWAEATETWDEAVYNWENTGALVISAETKNNLSISNEAKN
jgi:hypothetical protein